MTLERVLVAIGPNDRTHVEEMVSTTADVAGPADATVYLVHVFDEEEFEERQSRDRSRELSPDEIAASREDISAASEQLDEDGVDHEIRGVAGGEPTEQVNRLVERLDVGIVVIGGAKRSPTGKAVFGDHAQQILLNAPCPVLYVEKE